MTAAIDLSRTPTGQHQMWPVLFELSVRCPGLWTLVGGQMVLLHALERRTFPARPSHDLDLTADVQGRSVLGPDNCGGAERPRV